MILYIHYGQHKENRKKNSISLWFYGNPKVWGEKRKEEEKHDGIIVGTVLHDHQYADCLSVLIIIASYQLGLVHKTVWEDEGIGIFIIYTHGAKSSSSSSRGKCTSRQHAKGGVLPIQKGREEKKKKTKRRECFFNETHKGQHSTKEEKEKLLSSSSPLYKKKKYNFEKKKFRIPG